MRNSSLGVRSIEPSARSSASFVARSFFAIDTEAAALPHDAIFAFVACRFRTLAMAASAPPGEAPFIMEGLSCGVSGSSSEERLDCVIVHLSATALDAFSCSGGAAGGDLTSSVWRWDISTFARRSFVAALAATSSAADGTAPAPRSPWCARARRRACARSGGVERSTDTSTGGSAIRCPTDG